MVFLFFFTKEKYFSWNSRSNPGPVYLFSILTTISSTGGIIGLVLAVGNRGVSECLQDFKGWCGHVFTPRTMKSLALISRGSLYKTKPLKRILQDTFGMDTPLFGGGSTTPRLPVKVAVTTTLGQRRSSKPAILTNYNAGLERTLQGRECYSSAQSNNSNREQVKYDVVRPPDPEKEMKVWEAYVHCENPRPCEC